MKPRKKLFQNEEAEKKFSAIFDKAEKGDLESMMRILMKSGRGYEMSESDLSEILGNQEGC